MMRPVTIFACLVAALSAGCWYLTTEEGVENHRHCIETLHWAQRWAVRYVPQQKELSEALQRNQDVVACLVALRPGTVSTDLGDRPSLEFLIWLRMKAPEENAPEGQKRISELVRKAIREAKLAVESTTFRTGYEDQWVMKGTLRLADEPEGAKGDGK